MVFIFYYTGPQKIFYQVIYQIILIRIDIVFSKSYRFSVKKTMQIIPIHQIF